MNTLPGNLSRPPDIDLPLLRALALARGPSGCEDEVASLIEDAARSLPGAACSRDALGNVILTLARGGGKRRLFCCAMDEPTLVVTEALGARDGSACYRAQAVGHIDRRALFGKPVTLLREAPASPRCARGEGNYSHEIRVGDLVQQTPFSVADSRLWEASEGYFSPRSENPAEHSDPSYSVADTSQHNIPFAPDRTRFCAAAAVIGGAPIHLTKSRPEKPPADDELYLDCPLPRLPRGEASPDSGENPAESPFDIGDFAVFAGDFSQLGEGGHYLVCKAFETRAPCALLLQLARHAAAFPRESGVGELTFVFASRENAGMSGAPAAIERLRPDEVFSLGAATVRTPTPDGDPLAPGEPRLGGGVHIPLADRQTLYVDSPVRSRVIETARYAGIRFTEGPAAGDGSPRGLRTASGAPVVRLEIPVVNPGSPSVIVCREDLSAALALLHALLMTDDMG